MKKKLLILLSVLLINCNKDDNSRNVDNEIMITKNGKPAAVLISPDAFDSWKETSRIQFDEGLMAEIHEGLAALEKNHAGLYTLEELFQDSEK